MVPALIVSMAASLCCTPSPTFHTHAMIPSPSSSLQASLSNSFICKIRTNFRDPNKVKFYAILGKDTSVLPNRHCGNCSRLRIPWLPSVKTSNKISKHRALRDDTPASPPVVEETEGFEAEEVFTEVEDASSSTSLASPLKDFIIKAWDHKYLLSLAALYGIAPPSQGWENTGNYIQSIAVLATVITVHEAGHFLAARLQGIRVTKFAIGFGPTLAKWQGKEVEYSLRAIPLGGYVAFPDDGPQSGFKPDDPDLLMNRGILARALVISAGVIANIIFAYTILFGQVLTVGLVEQEYIPGVVIPEIIARSAASRGGLEAGDVVLSVAGKSLGATESSVFDLVDTIKDNPGRPLDFQIRREGFPDLLSIKITPDLAYDGAGKIGVQLSKNARLRRVKAANLGEATQKASNEFMRLTTTVTEGLKQIFLNFAQTADKLSGPVAIVAVGAEVAKSDIAGLFQFAAIVNINLAVVNTLPLPALDGGYFLLIALEALRGKKLPEGVEKGIMSSGILLLLAVGIVLMVRDTLNLGIVQELLR